METSDHYRYQLIENHFVPGPTLPTSFQSQLVDVAFNIWLIKYPWLNYSEHDNGGYCLPCVLFCKSSSIQHSDLGVLVSSPLVNFKKALGFLNKHLEKSYHKAAVAKMDAFSRVMSGQQANIRVQLNDAA